MSVKVFTKEELASIPVISLPKAYQRADQIPIDPTTIFASYQDALEYVSGESDYGNIAYAGQILSVIDSTNNKINVYKVNIDGSLSKIGEGDAQTLSATTYSDALLLATQENIGKIINVTTDETIGQDTYTAGLYIVAGVSVVSKLGTTSPSGDISGDVENLKTRVATLEGQVLELSESAYWIDGDEE